MTTQNETHRMDLSPFRLRRKESQKRVTSKKPAFYDASYRIRTPPRDLLPQRTSRWCVLPSLALHLVPFNPPTLLQSDPIQNKKNEDHLRPAPCLRRFGRRLCPPGLQQGATNETIGKGSMHEIGNIRFGSVGPGAVGSIDRRERPSSS